MNSFHFNSKSKKAKIPARRGCVLNTRRSAQQPEVDTTKCNERSFTWNTAGIIKHIFTAHHRSGEGYVFSLCFSVSNSVRREKRGPCTGSWPPPEHVQACSTWTSLYRALPRPLTCLLWSTDCQEAGGWDSTGMHSCSEMCFVVHTRNIPLNWRVLKHGIILVTAHAGNVERYWRTRKPEAQTASSNRMAVKASWSIRQAWHKTAKRIVDVWTTWMFKNYDCQSTCARKWPKLYCHKGTKIEGDCFLLLLAFDVHFPELSKY